MPAALGWRYAELDPETRKSFEVALHAGSAAALAIAVRRWPTSPRATALSLAPPALAGLAFERPIERRLGSPRWVGLTQVAAGLALIGADRRPAARRVEDARPLDHLLIGLAQAGALVPGVSRTGAGITLARLRRFERGAAARLSREAALPVIAAAAALKGLRMARRGLPPGLARPFAGGAAAAFVSTLGAVRLLARRDDHLPSYTPFAAYRIGLAVLVLARLRRSGPRWPPAPFDSMQT